MTNTRWGGWALAGLALLTLSGIVALKKRLTARRTRYLRPPGIMRHKRY